MKTKLDKRPAKFRQLAQTMQKQVDAQLNPAVANQRLTRRRSQMAESMARHGRFLQKVQQGLLAVADALEAGKLPEVLNALSSRADVEAVLCRNTTAALKKRGLEGERLDEAKLTLENMLPGEDPRAVRRQKLKAMERELVGLELPGFFPTPRPVCERMLELAEVKAEHLVLEPSAGKGDLLLAVAEEFKAPQLTMPGNQPHPELVAFEYNSRLSQMLCSVDAWMRDEYGFGFELNAPADFLEYGLGGRRFDRVLMNPPFEKGQDMQHVRHAYELLKPNGRLVSVMSAGVFFRSDRKTTEFREWLESVGGVQHELNDGDDGDSPFENAFRSTGARCVLVVLDKPAAVDESAKVQMYTTSPEAYDGSSTVTVKYVGTDSGKQVRLVECEKRDEEWQRSRYFSGCYSAYDAKNWKQLVASGLATEGESVLEQVRGLASGTLATVFGQSDCAKLDELHEELMHFAKVNVEAVGWQTWQDVVEAYKGNFTAADLAKNGERFAPVSGSRCRECGANPVLRPADEKWVVRQSAAYCPMCANPTDPEPEPPAAPVVEEAPKAAEPTAVEPVEEKTEEKPKAKRKGKKGKEEASEKNPAKTPMLRSMLLLPANLVALSKLAAKDSPRYAMNGVRVESTESGYRVAATNGKVLGVVTGDAGDPAEFPEVPGMKGAEATETSVVLPLKAWTDAFKSVPKKVYKPVLKNVATVLGKNSAVLATTDLDQANVLQPKYVDGRYPEYDAVWPKGQPKATFRMDAKLFASFLEVAAAFTGEDDGYCGVTVEFYGPEVPLVVRASNKSQRFDGAVMPLTPPAVKKAA